MDSLVFSARNRLNGHCDLLTHRPLLVLRLVKPVGKESLTILILLLVDHLFYCNITSCEHFIVQVG